jgi:hypothetical protein
MMLWALGLAIFSVKPFTDQEHSMRASILALALAFATSPAAAQTQTHQRHTAGHDSAHAIMLDDAQHLALHQLLLGHWAGAVEHRGERHDTLSLRFENDSSHQMLMIRHRDRVSGFEIRGDTLRWNHSMSGSECVATTPVSALLQATKAPPSKAEINGTLTCGANKSAFKLRKIGS